VSLIKLIEFQNSWQELDRFKIFSINHHIKTDDTDKMEYGGKI